MIHSGVLFNFSFVLLVFFFSCLIFTWELLERAEQATRKYVLKLEQTHG